MVRDGEEEQGGRRRRRSRGEKGCKIRGERRRGWERRRRRSRGEKWRKISGERRSGWEHVCECRGGGVGVGWGGQHWGTGRWRCLKAPCV